MLNYYKSTQIKHLARMCIRGIKILGMPGLHAFCVLIPWSTLQERRACMHDLYHGLCGRIKVVDHEEPASDGKKEQE